MKTNRLISRHDARALELSARISLEKEVTDAIGDQIHRPTVAADWNFETYRNCSPWRRYLYDFLGDPKGKAVLDLGCGYNPTPIYFALAGAAQVAACDVSPKALEHIRKLARINGVSDRVTTHLAPAERLPFQEGNFTLVHGEAVLHHLDLPLAGAEICRVLKPGGRAAFKDPLGQNRLLEFARDYLPYRWKHHVKGTDFPLKFADVEGFSQHFSQCAYRGFGFFSMLPTALLGRRQTLLHGAAHRLDAFFLTRLPFLQRYCRFVVTCAVKGAVEPGGVQDARGDDAISKGGQA